MNSDGSKDQLRPAPSDSGEGDPGQNREDELVEYDGVIVEGDLGINEQELPTNQVRRSSKRSGRIIIITEYLLKLGNVPAVHKIAGGRIAPIIRMAQAGKIAPRAPATTKRPTGDPAPRSGDDGRAAGIASARPPDKRWDLCGAKATDGERGS